MGEVEHTEHDALDFARRCLERLDDSAVRGGVERWEGLRDAWLLDHGAHGENGAVRSRILPIDREESGEKP